MKVAKMLGSMMMGGALIASAAVAQVSVAADHDDVRNIKVSRLFSPKGLDSNDNSIVILDGYLPDGCYRLTAPIVETDETAKSITIQARANYFDVPCIEALVPFTQEVKLGMLTGGIYNIQDNEGTNIGSLNVSKAQSKYPDDYLYAPVDTIILDNEEAAPGQHVVTLRGRFTNSCMFMERVETRYFPDSVELLPIMGIRKGNCLQVEVPFSVDVTLDSSKLAKGRMLVHARSLNGNSVSAMLNVGDK
ncbi:MAG: hypothetical protein RIQ81_903 [Pseudomonadota bacterium]